MTTNLNLSLQNSIKLEYVFFTGYHAQFMHKFTIKKKKSELNY